MRCSSHYNYIEVNTVYLEILKKKDLYQIYGGGLIYNDKAHGFLKEKNGAYYLILKIHALMCTTRTNKAIFYVHNLNLAGMLLMSDLSKHGVALDFLLDEHNLYSLTIFFEQKKILFRCSYRLIPVELSAIAQSRQHVILTQPKTFLAKGDLYYRGPIAREEFNDNESFLTYSELLNLEDYLIFSCKHNARLLKDFIDEMFTIFKQDFKLEIATKSILTAAALGNYCFFNFFNKKSLAQQIPKEIEIFVKNAFFGGRCEVFGNPNADELIYHFDFEGMYGQCLAEANVYGPASFKKCKSRAAGEKLQPGFYNVDWKSANYLPVLPHHNVITGKLLFTNGLGNGTY